MRVDILPLLLPLSPIRNIAAEAVNGKPGLRRQELILLPVGNDCGDIDRDGENRKHYEIERQIRKMASFQAHGSQDIHEIPRRQDGRDILGPGFHRADLSIDPAHQHKDQDYKEHQEN